MNSRRFIKSYKTLMLLSILLSLLTVSYFIQNKLIDELTNSSENIKNHIRKLHINETKDKLAAINESMAKLSLPNMDKKLARDWLLKVMEEFRELYDARIVTPISESENLISTEITFTLKPEKIRRIYQTDAVPA